MIETTRSPRLKVSLARPDHERLRDLARAESLPLAAVARTLIVRGLRAVEARDHAPAAPEPRA